MKTAPRQIIDRLNKLGLRAKLTFGFLLVLSSTVIVGTTSLFTEKRGAAAIERLLDTETRIADISRNSEVAVRLTRQHEKDFLLQYRSLGFDEAKARYATSLKVEVAEIHQNMDAIRHLIADESVISQTRAIDAAMDQFEMKFLATTELIKQRGFFEVGVEGQFRKKIHEVEAILTQQRAESLLVDMLTLRRWEKDFLLRDREQDALALKEGAAQLQRRIASSNLQPDLKEALRKLVSDYQALFEQYVQLDEQITIETETYRTIVHSVEPLLGQLRTWALQRADASRDQVLQSSKTNERIVVVTVGIAIVLGLLLAFLISRGIAGGVNECMVFARRLAQGDLGARMKRSSHDEFGAIATALNSMAEQLQKNKGDLLAEITERKWVEAEAGERARLAALEADVGTALTRGGTLAEMLRLCSEAIVRHLDAAFARIWTLNEREKMLELQASAGMYTHLNGPHGRVPVGKFKIGLIAEERKPHLTNQVVGDPRVGDQEWAKREGMIAFAGYPLLVEDRLVGVAAMFARHTLTEMTLTALASIANNIALGTERKRAEEALRLLSSAVEQAKESITITDAELVSSGPNIIFVNPAFTKMTGYTAEEAIGKTPWILQGPRTDKTVLSRLRQNLERGEVFEGEAINYRKDGTEFDLEWQIAPLRNAGGKITHFVAIQRDITDRKRAQAELENVHKQLLEASRRGGMAEIATNVLHNVGNVLNSVNVSASLAVESVRKSEASRLAKAVELIREHESDLGIFITTDPRGKLLPTYLAQLSENLIANQKASVKELNSLRGNIEHIKEIVSMQQSYARVSGVKEIVSINYLVEDSLRMNVNALGRHGVEVIREFEDVPLINIDKHKVLQILVNLVRNAKYACEESGRVDKRLTVRVANGDQWIKISVIDNGVGVPRENLTRIFNHGFTTRKDGHGFGLHSGALAAKEMGGSLTVHSDGPGQGAAFTLELPCSTRENSHD